MTPVMNSTTQKRLYRTPDVTSMRVVFAGWLSMRQGQIWSYRGQGYRVGAKLYSWPVAFRVCRMKAVKPGTEDLVVVIGDGVDPGDWTLVEEAAG